MIQFVTKKNGAKVPFDSEKIKSAVMAAAAEAGLSDQESSEAALKILSSVIMAFEGQEEVATSQIKEKILSELDASTPSVSESWRKYDLSHSK